MTDLNRRYALRYDDGSIEYVSALCATGAVAQRDRDVHKERPHTITDLTALNEWVKGSRPRAGIHMPVEFGPNCIGGPMPVEVAVPEWKARRDNA